MQKSANSNLPQNKKVKNAATPYNPRVRCTAMLATINRFALGYMDKINVKKLSAKLPCAWKSSVIGQAADANLKVLRMDESAYDEEVHDYAEALIVLNGCLNLTVAGQVVHVSAGEMYIVPPGVPHGVAAGSGGILLIVDKQILH